MRSRIFNEISWPLSPRKVKRKMGRAFKWKRNDAAGIIVQGYRRTGKMWAGSLTVTSETTKTFQQASGGCQAF